MSRYRKIEQIKDLKVGQIIKSKTTEVCYVVVAHYGDRVTAVRTADVTSAIEWEVLKDVDN